MKGWDGGRKKRKAFRQVHTISHGPFGGRWRGDSNTRDAARRECKSAEELSVAVPRGERERMQMALGIVERVRERVDRQKYIHSSNHANCLRHKHWGEDIYIKTS